MRDPNTDRQIAFLAALGGLAVGVLAFRFGGFLGMGLAGLLMGFVAVRLDLEKEDVGGGFPSPHLYGRQVAVRDGMDPAERAAARQAWWLPLMIAKTISAGLVVCGFGAFFLLV